MKAKKQKKITIDSLTNTYAVFYIINKWIGTIVDNRLIKINNLKQKFMNTGKVILGVVAGAAVGAAIGMLFAPKAGAELRKNIADKGGDALKGIKDKVSGLAEAAEEKAMGLVDKGKSKLEDGISKLEDKVHSEKKDAKSY
jgi:gas vesicle protein